jgi:hypothetical protein
MVTFRTVRLERDQHRINEEARESAIADAAQVRNEFDQVGGI